jgi:paraquat-inducible protein B
MPVILRLEGYSFLFYSNEGTPREPAHIHVRKARDEAKFWLFPIVALA